MTTARLDLRPANRWLYVGLAGMLALSVGVQMVRDRGWVPFVPPNPTLWLSSGPLARKMSLGFRNLAADVYWIRAVVYYGGKRRAAADQGPPNFDLLYPLLDLVTALDPQFKVAYKFGAIFLTEAYPNGPGRPDLAIALLQRGIEHGTARWELMQDIGFVHYWWLRDFKKAAEWFKLASEQEGAPNWLAALAATTLAEGGDRASSRFLWAELRENSDVDWVRRNAQLRLQQLDAMDTIDELNRYVQRFAAREKRPPRDSRELIAAEGLRFIPADPTGTPFVFDPATGQIDLAPTSTLHPLPWEPRLLGMPPS